MADLSEIIRTKSLYFGDDMYELYLKEKDIKFLNELVYEIDLDNSNSSYIELSGVRLHYSKSAVNGYDFGFSFTFVFNGEIIDFFKLLFPRKITSDDYDITLVIYSQVLTLYNLESLNFDLIQFLKSNFLLENSDLRRVDLALDLSIDKGPLLPFFKKFASKIALQKDGYYQTYYTREIQTDKNRLMTTRIYDKKKDSFKKDKAFLFPHLDNDFVNRIEVEIRKDYASRIPYKFYDIITNKKVKLKLFRQFLNYDLKKEYKVKDDDFYLLSSLKADSDLDFKFRKLGFIPSSYLQNAEGYAKKIFKVTGYKGFMQFIFGVFFDDFDKIHRLPSGDIRYKFGRTPEDFIREYLFFLRDSLHYSDFKINHILKSHIVTPKVKIYENSRLC